MFPVPPVIKVYRNPTGLCEKKQQTNLVKLFNVSGLHCSSWPILKVGVEERLADEQCLLWLHPSVDGATHSQVLSSSVIHWWCGHTLFLWSPSKMFKVTRVKHKGIIPTAYLAWIMFQWGMKMAAYIDLNFFVKVQLIVEHIICAVLAAVVKTKHREPKLHWQIAVISEPCKQSQKLKQFQDVRGKKEKMHLNSP